MINEDNNTQINDSNNSDENNNSDNNGQGITLITGNLIDEFGLETDLGRILGEATPLPNLTEENNISGEGVVNETIPNISEGTITNEIVGVNETAAAPSSSILEFTLYSTNEDFIVSQIADVTGLSSGEVRKLINFVYLEPVGFEDEVIEDLQLSLDFIEKVNGSVIIKLG